MQQALTPISTILMESLCAVTQYTLYTCTKSHDGFCQVHKITGSLGVGNESLVSLPLLARVQYAC